MNIKVFKNYNLLSEAAANQVLQQVSLKPDSLLCFASGDSPTGTLDYLIQYAKQGKIDFSSCFFVGLDEWIGMDEKNEGSCKHYLYTHFFNHLKIERQQIRLFDAKCVDTELECLKMNNFINEKGGLDLIIVGVGINGHIGLNEPGTNFSTYAHYSILDEVTIKVGQKYFKQQTELPGGITLGLRHLTESKKAILIASGNKKADIIVKALEGTISATVPASIFQTIPGSYILLDNDSAGKLKKV